jgi:zinc protease
LRLLAPALLLPGLLSAPAQLAAQPAAAPREEQLLNGLRIFFFPRPGAQKVWMRLRVNSGAAFDLAGKEGTSRLLADALFPNPTTGQYVAEELGGRLQVRADYDAIEVTLSGDASRFNDLAEVLRNAVLQMRLSPDDVRRLKDARIELFRDRGETAASAADRAAGARLFGAYPYGRPAEGTVESIERVSHYDLTLARDRFLNPNNSLLAVVGPVEQTRAMRTFRQFLGPWRKSEETAPATFRQPAAPAARTLLLDVPRAPHAEIRLAARGLARSDRDRNAATLLAAVATQRWFAALKDVTAARLAVAHDSYSLGGVFRMNAAVHAEQCAQAIEAARATLRSLTTTPATAAELEAARRDLSAALQDGRNAEYDPAADWLDSVAFGHPVANSARAIHAITPADLQRVATRLFRDAPAATVVAGDASALRAALASLPGGIEEGPGKELTPASAPQQAMPAAGRRP